MEEDQQQYRADQRRKHRVLEDGGIVDPFDDGRADDALGGIGILEDAAQEVRGERADAEDQDVEQTLGTGAHVLWEELVDEDVDGGKEKGVADAMHRVDQDGRRGLWPEGEDGEAGAVAEDAEDHGPAPAEAFEDVAEEEDRQDFGDLADLHDGADPVGGDVDEAAVAAWAEEGEGPEEEALVHGRVDECDDEKDEDEGPAQIAHGFEPGE